MKFLYCQHFNSSIILISESVFAFLILLAIMIYDYQVFIILVVYSIIIISVFKIVIKDEFIIGEMKGKEFKLI